MSQNLIMGLAAIYAFIHVVGLAADTSSPSLFAAGVLSVPALAGSNTVVIRAPYGGMVDGQPVGIRGSSLARLGAHVQFVTEIQEAGQRRALASDAIYRVIAVAQPGLGVGSAGPEPQQQIGIDPALQLSYPAGTRILTEAKVDDDGLKTPKEVRPNENFLVAFFSWGGKQLDEVSGVLKFALKIASMDYSILKHEGDFFGVLRLILAGLQWGAVIMLGIFTIRTVRGF